MATRNRSSGRRPVPVQTRRLGEHRLPWPQRTLSSFGGGAEGAAHPRDARPRPASAQQESAGRTAHRRPRGVRHRRRCISRRKRLRCSSSPPRTTPITNGNPPRQLHQSPGRRGRRRRPPSRLCAGTSAPRWPTARGRERGVRRAGPRGGFHARSGAGVRHFSASSRWRRRSRRSGAVVRGDRVGSVTTPRTQRARST